MISSLPNELILEILAYLSQPDYKCVRFISRAWADLAAEFIFSTLYIRPSDRRLTAATNIANSISLNRLVTGINFDIRLFEQELTKRDYIELLLGQIRQQLLLQPTSFQSVDYDQSALIELARRPLPLNIQESIAVESNAINLPSITQGYEKYIRHAKEQRNWLQNPYFLDEMTRILRQVRRVRRIIFNDSWILYQPPTGVLNVSKTSSLEPGWTGYTSCSEQMFAYLKALEKSKLSVQSWHFLLDTPLRIHQGLKFQEDVSVFRNTKALSIEIGPHRFDAMSTLQPIVNECRALKHFKLYATYWPDYSDTSYWSTKEILLLLSPQNSRLEEVSLFKVVVDVSTICNFFQIHSQLHSIHLNDARIEGNFEHFHIKPNGYVLIERNMICSIPQDI